MSDAIEVTEESGTNGMITYDLRGIGIHDWSDFERNAHRMYTYDAKLQKYIYLGQK